MRNKTTPLDKYITFVAEVIEIIPEEKRHIRKFVIEEVKKKRDEAGLSRFDDECTEFCVDSISIEGIYDCSKLK